MRRSTVQYILYVTKDNDKGTHSIYMVGEYEELGEVKKE
jgi:hypothetical protein